MPVIDLYGFLPSAPCRSVLLTAKLLGVPINLIDTRPHTPETERADFAKMNPQKTVPTMNDSGLFLNESRAMLQYLCNKYAKNDKYYPKVPNERALVDCRLSFDMGTLYGRFADAYFPVLFADQPAFSEDKLKKIDEALDFLDTYLEHGYVAGGKLTIADVSIVVSLSTMEAAGQDFSRLPKVRDYLVRLKKELPGYQEINQKGLDVFKAFVAQKLDKARRPA